eukprot:m.893447 g.893447  ORF g.893447 m.893447 type:complete len:293 (+) comp23660_c1_seq2:155-1033(+)
MSLLTLGSMPSMLPVMLLVSVASSAKEVQQMTHDAVTCPGAHTICPAGDLCCVGTAPDSYRVPGGYGCLPPGSTNWTGCAEGGVKPNGCCCGPGPSNISSTVPNVLVIGDSVSAGYTPFLRSALGASANVQHGPDNAGGGNADGASYGSLCTKYFIRTPTFKLPDWKVITFNFGLHDAGDTDSAYRAYMENITATLQHDTGPATHLVYFTTTIPEGSAEPAGDPNNVRVRAQNAIATDIMRQHNIPVVDLYATMEACGTACVACKPHCEPAGYEYLVTNAIAPAVKKLLAGQ